MSGTDRPVSERLPLPPVASLGLGLVVIGGAVVFDPWGYNGYLASKVLVAGLGLLLLVASLSKRSGLVVPAGIGLAVVSVMVALLVVASAMSVSVWRSVLGAPLRQEGLLAWLGFVVAFVVGLSLRRRYGDAVSDSLVKLAVLAVIAVTAVGAFELVGLEIDPELTEFRGRTRATLGNPAVLAGFLILVGPVATVAIARRDWWRWAGWLAVCGAVVNIAGAETRSVWLVGVALGVGVGLLGLSGRRRALLVAVLLLALLATLFTGRWQQVGGDFGERVSIWEVAVSVVLDNPLFGVGPEMFIVAFEENVSDNTSSEIGGGAALDRAHNGVLDFAVSYGAVAAGLYLLALVFVGWLVVRAVSGGDRFRLALGFGVAAYLLAQQSLFPHPTSDIVCWLLVGILAADSSIAVRRLPRLVDVVALAVVVALIFNAGSVVRNDRLYRTALESPSFAGAYQHLERAASHRSGDDLSYILMGVLLADTPDVSTVVRGIEQLAEGTERNPGNGQVTRAFADGLLQAHRLTGDRSFAAESVHSLSELIETQPSNGDSYLRRGAGWYYLGDMAAARSDWERAAFLLPDRPEPSEYLQVLADEQ